MQYYLCSSSGKLCLYEIQNIDGVMLRDPLHCVLCSHLQGNSGSVPTSLVLFSGPARGGREPLGQSGTVSSPERPQHPGSPLNCAPCRPQGDIQMQWKQRTREAEWVSVLLREEVLPLLFTRLICLLMSTGWHCWSALTKPCSLAPHTNMHITPCYTLYPAAI